MNEQIFQEIGLTNAETKVYLALLKTGSTTAGPLLKETGLQNSTLHKTLHSLVSKGFASFIIKGKIRHYQASDPETVLKFIQEKENRFQKMLPQLKLLQKPIEKQEAEIFEGFKGFKNMVYEFIKGGKKGDEYLFFSFYAKNPDDYEDLYNFYGDFAKEREKLGIIIKGIAPKNRKDKFKGRNIKNILFVDFPIPLNISIFNNKVIFTPWEDKKVSFLINSRQLAESFRQYFYSIWKQAKK
tara:strand:+ start:52 stop:774 length:723 start_codon:yes stop_codon:yes gene_type:complete